VQIIRCVVQQPLSMLRAFDRQTLTLLQQFGRELRARMRVSGHFLFQQCAKTLGGRLTRRWVG
jgi:hypothetical protein